MHALDREFRYESDTPLAQIVFPISGVHYMGTGAREVLLDLNQVAIIPKGLVTRDRHPDVGDVACMVLTPSEELLDELSRRAGVAPTDIAATTALIQPSTPTDQLSAAILATCARQNGGSRAFVEEMLVGVLGRAIANGSPPDQRIGPGAIRLVRRAREVLACSVQPLGLSDVAAAVGASPTYLTDVFRKIEGMPLYRFQLRLRLARALAHLPKTDDITGLAFDLGFSSHSHFSSAFKALYGETPSAYRANIRNARL